MERQFVAAGIAAAMAFASTAARAALDDTSAQDLMKKAGCVACHSVDKKLLGPSYKDIALKRKAAPDAAAMLEKRVRDGSKGEYGAIPMPPNPTSKIGDPDLHELVLWVLTR